MSLLTVAHVTKRIGGLVAVNDVSFRVAPSEMVGIIGPNGAGKTTLFNVISGFLRADAGRVQFNGTEVTHRRPDEICRLGLVRTFQHAQPFPQLTVLENAMIGAFVRYADRRPARERAREALRLLDLDGRAATPAGRLSPAELKRLELARAVATEPKMLLLDECMAGLRPLEVAALVDSIRRLNASGVTVVLIEHVISAMTALAERIVVLHHGVKLAEGAPGVVFSDDAVVEAYLGRDTVLAER
jgi:branched-chain amino acid transport system ATP-binding protein